MAESRPSTNPASILFAKQRDRADISGIVPSIVDGTYSPWDDGSMYTASPAELSYIEAFKLFEQTKPERYALAAACIQEIWQSYAVNRALHLDPNTRDPDPKTLPVLKALSQHMFTTATDSWLTTVRANKNHPHAPMLSRLESMLRFSVVHGIMKENTTEVFLRRGIRTATDVMWATIGTIPKLAEAYNIRMTKQEALQTIRGAYAKVIAPLSHMNITFAVSILEHLFGIHAPEFDPAFFTLEQHNGIYTFALNYAVIAQMRDLKQVPITDLSPYGKTVWCPANASIATDTSTVIEDMFEWSVQMADRYLIRLNRLPGGDLYE